MAGTGSNLSRTSQVVNANDYYWRKFGAVQPDLPDWRGRTPGSPLPLTGGIKLERAVASTASAAAPTSTKTIQSTSALRSLDLTKTMGSSAALGYIQLVSVFTNTISTALSNPAITGLSWLAGDFVFVVTVGPSAVSQNASISYDNGGNYVSMGSAIATHTNGTVTTSLFGVEAASDCSTSGRARWTAASGTIRVIGGLVLRGVSPNTYIDQSAGATGSSTTPSSRNLTAAYGTYVWSQIVTVGPGTDATGTWDNNFTSIDRDGSSSYTPNITLDHAYRQIITAGSIAGSKQSITSRDWTALAVSFRSRAQSGRNTVASTAALRSLAILKTVTTNRAALSQTKTKSAPKSAAAHTIKIEREFAQVVDQGTSPIVELTGKSWDTDDLILAYVSLQHSMQPRMISKVEISCDGGLSWVPARYGAEWANDPLNGNGSGFAISPSTIHTEIHWLIAPTSTTSGIIRLSYDPSCAKILSGAIVKGIAAVEPINPSRNIYSGERMFGKGESATSPKTTVSLTVNLEPSYPLGLHVGVLTRNGPGTDSLGSTPSSAWPSWTTGKEQFAGKYRGGTAADAPFLLNQAIGYDMLEESRTAKLSGSTMPSRHYALASMVFRAAPAKSQPDVRSVRFREVNNGDDQPTFVFDSNAISTRGSTVWSSGNWALVGVSCPESLPASSVYITGAGADGGVLYLTKNIEDSVVDGTGTIYASIWSGKVLTSVTAGVTIAATQAGNSKEAVIYKIDRLQDNPFYGSASAKEVNSTTGTINFDSSSNPESRDHLGFAFITRRVYSIDSAVSPLVSGTNQIHDIQSWGNVTSVLAGLSFADKTNQAFHVDAQLANTGDGGWVGVTGIFRTAIVQTRSVPSSAALTRGDHPTKTVVSTACVGPASWSDRFETGDLSRWTSTTTTGTGSVVIDDASGFSGKGAGFSLGANGVSWVSKTIDESIRDAPVLAVDTMLRHTAIGNNAHSIWISLYDSTSGTDIVYLRLQNQSYDSFVRYPSYGDFEGLLESPWGGAGALAANTWYNLKLVYNRNDPRHPFAEFHLNGVVYRSSPSYCYSLNPNSLTPNQLRVGVMPISGNEIATVQFDNLTIGTSSSVERRVPSDASLVVLPVRSVAFSVALSCQGIVLSVVSTTTSLGESFSSVPEADVTTGDWTPVPLWQQINDP